MFALSQPQVLFQPDEALPARGRLLVYRLPGGNGASEPTAGEVDRLGLPSDVAVSARVPVAAVQGDRVLTASLPALAILLEHALPHLLAVTVRGAPAWRRPPDSLRAWAVAARIALRLVGSERIAPTLAPTGDGAVHAVWRVITEGDHEARTALDGLAAAMPPAAHALAHRAEADAVWAPEELLLAFCDAVADLAARRGGPPPRPGRPRDRLLPWTARWSEALADPADPCVPLGDDAAELLAGVASWYAMGDPGVAVTELRLASPDTGEGPWVISFGIRTPGGLVPAKVVWAGEAPEDDRDGLEVAPDLLREVLLRGLARCARVFPPLDTALRSADPESVEVDLEDAWRFVHEVGPLLEGSDVLAVFPDDLVLDGLQLRMRLGDEVADDVLEEEPAGPLPLAEDVAYRWELTLDGEVIDPADLERLLDRRSTLVRWRGRWVALEPELAQRLARVRGGGWLGGAEALILALTGAVPLAEVVPPELAADLAADEVRDRAPQLVEVVADGGVAAALERLREPTTRPPVPVTPSGFVGELRPYQRRGVAWLQGMADLGLGAVLADDMGLGKTIQLIAHLLDREGRPSLVVCPTSVVGNWERELQRFAPGLDVTRFHGPERPGDLADVRGVVVTTYGLLRRDPDPLVAVDWDVVALDEAQHVKNPATAGAKAVRRLRARQVVALTGTPLENRLAELWALLDATNRGLMGGRAGFGRLFVAPIERDNDRRAAVRLRRLVAPFVLRREKSDPAVAADLPDKIERTVACTLTPEQAELYQRAVDEALGTTLAEASAMERRGRILALLTRLKQICNHPVHYLHGSDGVAPAELAGRSGKLAVAREIVNEAVEAGDQVLVFTQYVEMGHLLVTQLAHDLDVDVPFLHGAVSAGARDRMVAGFQGEVDEPPPVLVVSLRAGGLGLNLTAATHVVHYDRWWNPAVEDQATDRAHRIGQRRTVEVHKLVTAGTIEERAAAMLERKRALAQAVVGAGETWITELTDDELHDLVALSADAVEDITDEEPDWPLAAAGARSGAGAGEGARSGAGAGEGAGATRSGAGARAGAGGGTGGAR